VNFASLGSVQVLDPASGALVGLDLDALLEELRGAFRRCAIREEWMAENLLGVLRERLREDLEDGVCATAEEVRRMLSDVLLASGFSDVSEEFLSGGGYREAVSSVPNEFSDGLRSWTADTLEKFLRGQSDIPGEMIPELLRRMSSMLSGAGISEVSESLVLEIARHLVHFLGGDDLASSTVAVTSPVRYITQCAWDLPVEISGQSLLSHRVVVLQPVSDIVPVAVVQCHLLRLFDEIEETPVSEAVFLSRMVGVSAFLQQCLVLMRGKMRSCWPDVQFSGAVVRMMGFSGALKILCSARRRKERRELGLRLEEAIRGNFANAPFSVVVRFS